jgi:hypothetical protein
VREGRDEDGPAERDGPEDELGREGELMMLAGEK